MALPDTVGDLQPPTGLPPAGDPPASAPLAPEKSATCALLERAHAGGSGPCGALPRAEARLRYVCGRVTVRVTAQRGRATASSDPPVALTVGVAIACLRAVRESVEHDDRKTTQRRGQRPLLAARHCQRLGLDLFGLCDRLGSALALCWCCSACYSLITRQGQSPVYLSCGMA